MGPCAEEVNGAFTLACAGVEPLNSRTIKPCAEGVVEFLRTDTLVDREIKLLWEGTVYYSGGHLGGRVVGGGGGSGSHWHVLGG